jgi:hypothetical protein
MISFLEAAVKAIVITPFIAAWHAYGAFRHTYDVSFKQVVAR